MIRKLTRVGGSLALVLPPPVLELFGLKEKPWLKIQVSDDGKGLLLTPTDEPVSEPDNLDNQEESVTTPTGPVAPAFELPAAEILKRLGPAWDVVNEDSWGSMRLRKQSQLGRGSLYIRDNSLAGSGIWKTRLPELVAPTSYENHGYPVYNGEQLAELLKHLGKPA